ncbi:MULTISPECIES: hypothetical protein [Marinobacter]|uniref:Uncharacterized protein n=1 Tax=Marinobacter suaedae TaxID=3057675 RepID=A0ABT8VZA5_9GAMM|nr:MULTISPECIES: hypothetical protein [unclassified Marinobacter]MBZ2169440.1 hypothetical protein [Marinobacter sp. F4216]MDO3721305.1 hypothetical protein [Marinobacter sp. chi1]
MKSVLLIALMGMMVGAAPALAKSSHNELPPGLQKKVAKGGQLPPGWQKKLNGYHRGDRLDHDHYHYGDIYDMGNGRQRVEIEDRVYTIIKDTREIIDILNRR